MARGERKTVLKTIRLSPEEEELLTAEARSRGVTFNALVSSVLTRYLEWDRFAEKYGFVALPRQSYRFLTSLLSEQELAEFGRETGAQNASAIAHFWYKQLGVNAFLAFLAISAKYCGIWHYDLARRGSTFVLTVHNDIAPKYNAVHRQYFDQAIRGILGVVPKVEQKGNAVVFTFPEPPTS